jgi:branched-chain amino acid transport system permease protein
MDWINAIIQGTLLGGLYALFAAGLSLIFGVMRLVNIAHGDLIVLGAYLGLSTTLVLGIHPDAWNRYLATTSCDIWIVCDHSKWLA